MICTSIEQSKKLIELGIDITTADMCWCNENDVITIPYIDSAITLCPAWSLSALMKLLPSEFTTENKFGKHKYEIEIRKYKLANNVDIYQIAYGNYKWYEDGSNSWKDMINTGQKEELVDVAFEMVCWLKENGNI